MKLIIIAAGQGSRIRSVTDGIPKTLLKLKGKSLLDRVLENAVTVGIQEAVVVTGYRSTDLMSYIDNHKFEINPMHTITIKRTKVRVFQFEMREFEVFSF